MGKRQIRIKGNEISEKLNSILNTELNLILKNDIPLHGKIINILAEELVFKDMILRKHLLKINQIAEIIIDTESDY